MKKFEINERVILSSPNSVFGGEVVNITKINKQQYEIKHINGDYSSVNERNLRKLPKKEDWKIRDKSYRNKSYIIVSHLHCKYFSLIQKTT